MIAVQSKHWTPARMGWLFRPISERDHPDETVLSVFRDHGVVPKDSRSDNFNRTPESLNAYQLVQPGDLVVNRMKAWQGSLGISPYRGIVSPDYEILRPITTDVDPRYLHQLLRSRPLIDQYGMRSTGIRPSQWRLYWDQMKTIEVALPPLEEQRAIADYLDHETAKIDTLIAKQERLIATLRERRGGLIERALVGGLDPAVRLRTTVIPWLAGASVPAHWESTRVKYLALEMRAGEGITAEDIEDVGAYRVFGGNGLRGYATAYTHSGTFVLIGRQGALCGNVHLVHGEFWASEHAIVVTPSKRTDAGWLAHMLRLMNLGQYSMTTAQPGIGVGQIGPLMVPLPPLDEQREIATYIDEQASKIDTLIAKTERFIELSKERRAALITAAVTGQIDVRAAA